MPHLPQSLSAAPRRTGRRAAAAARAVAGSSRLYSSLVVGGIKKKIEGSACVNTHKLGALTNRMSNPPRCSARAPRQLRREPDACSRRAALAEAPTGPGCGTARLCRPPLQLLLSSTLRTCPAGSTFPPTPPPSLPRRATEIRPPPSLARSPPSAEAAGSPKLKKCYFLDTFKAATNERAAVVHLHSGSRLSLK